jgi:hypothetical protein
LVHRVSTTPYRIDEGQPTFESLREALALLERAVPAQAQNVELVLSTGAIVVIWLEPLELDKRGKSDAP